jgi:hypothetical protein
MAAENAAQVLRRGAVLFADDRLALEGGFDHGLGRHLRLGVGDGYEISLVAVLGLERDGGPAVLEMDRGGGPARFFSDAAALL